MIDRNIAIRATSGATVIRCKRDTTATGADGTISHNGTRVPTYQVALVKSRVEYEAERRRTTARQTGIDGDRAVGIQAECCTLSAGTGVNG